MLTGVHFLLSYMCNAECDHCFVYSGPYAVGTFTVAQIHHVLKEVEKIGTVEMIYFEGGEPFLFYPVMLEGIRIAKRMGFKIGVVTNSYFATSLEDVELWFRPLVEIGIEDLSLSDDHYHFEDERDNPSTIALEAAKRLGLPVSTITIESPTVKPDADKGEPVIRGGTVFRGRAVEKLIKDLPRRPWWEFTECPYEELQEPKRIHVDVFGNVQLCQGLSMGNLWKIPLNQLIKNYNAVNHPICRPLIEGGPSLLSKEYGFNREDSYVDACHLCFRVRRGLIDRFPEYLTPKQVYGLE